MSLPTDARKSPSVQRNAEPILAVLRTHLADQARVLEIASGSGQHAMAFAGALPRVSWTPTDPDAEALKSIAAWRNEADLPNLAAPVRLDAADPTSWPQGPFDAVVCINMIHISPWAATEGLMAGAAAALASTNGLLVLYGPYHEVETPLAPSNDAFDQDLKRRNPQWGLRTRDAVVAEAEKNGLTLTRRVEMPANNLMLLFRYIP